MSVAFLTRSIEDLIFAGGTAAAGFQNPVTRGYADYARPARHPALRLAAAAVQHAAERRGQSLRRL